MTSIEAAFVGRLAQAPQLRNSKAGKPWCSFSVCVGEGDAPQWVRVAVFGEQVEAAVKMTKGARVYVEGRLTLQAWKTEGGIERSGLNVAATQVQALGRIGRRRPPGSKRASAGVDFQAPLVRSSIHPMVDPLHGGDATPF